MKINLLIKKNRKRVICTEKRGENKDKSLEGHQAFHSFQDQPQVRGAAAIVTDYLFDLEVLLSQFYLLLLSFAVDPDNYWVAADTVVSLLY